MNFSKQAVEILGVPVDLGSNPLGVEMGPAALRYAGLSSALSANGIHFRDTGDLPIKRPIDPNGSISEIEKMSVKVADFVSESIVQGCFPLVLGGDHSLSIGTITGAARTCQKLGLVWLDCHPDANTPESSPSGNIHGMTVAISLGQGYRELVWCGGFSPKVHPENICILGAKDIDEAEREFLEELGVRMFTLFDIERHGIMDVFEEAMEIVTDGTDAVHLSFDVDALDPVIAPGTGILTRGGLNYREITYIMKTLGQRGVIASMDVIEINPLLDTRNMTAELCVELILSALGGSYGDYERNYLNAVRR